MNEYEDLLSVLSKCNTRYISIITDIKLYRNSAIKIQ